MSGVDYDSVAEIYDLYVTADYDIPYFLTEAEEVTGPVLELAAGTGRVSVPLVEAGVRLTCVDISRAMLDVLAQKLSDRGLQADVRCADVCRLDFKETFELALFPFQSFMEIVGEERQRQALATVFSCLTHGGRFICTLHNPNIRRTQIDGTLRIVGRFSAGDETLIVSGFEQGGQPVVQRVQFFELYRSDGSQRSKKLLSMEFELVEQARFESMARAEGFRVVGLYGDYQRSPFDPARSPVMVWVLGK